MSEKVFVDSQVHMGPGGIEETVAAMDALGIQTVMVDEYWIGFGDRPLMPNVMLPGGVMRSFDPTVTMAAQLHPGRFHTVRRLWRGDPLNDAILELMRDDPHSKSVRLIPGMLPVEIEAFDQGGYDSILAKCEELGMPVCIFLQDRPDLVGGAAERFPKLPLIVDNCGLYNNKMRVERGMAELSGEGQFAMFERVLTLSEYPNVAMKWGHASELFDTPTYPGTGLWPVLRMAVDAFGADRILWASDFSVNTRGETWSEHLFGVRDNPLLSDQEKELVLSGSAKKWFRL